MSRDFPDWINPWAAAQGRRRFAGTVPLRRMRRLAELTESDAGEAAFEARFFLDEDRRPGIELEVAAELELMCQASLAPFTTTVQRRSRLGVIEEESEMALSIFNLCSITKTHIMKIYWKVSRSPQLFMPPRPMWTV